MSLVRRNLGLPRWKENIVCIGPCTSSCVCRYMYIRVYRGYRSLWNAFLSLSPSFMTHPERVHRLDWLARKPQGCSVSLLGAAITDAPASTPALSTWVLEFRTQASVRAWQVLYWLNHLPCPLFPQENVSAKKCLEQNLNMKSLRVFEKMERGPNSCNDKFWLAGGSFLVIFWWFKLQMLSNWVMWLFICLFVWIRMKSASQRLAGCSLWILKSKLVLKEYSERVSCILDPGSRATDIKVIVFWVLRQQRCWRLDGRYPSDRSSQSQSRRAVLTSLTPSQSTGSKMCSFLCPSNVSNDAVGGGAGLFGSKTPF